jgi:hypothetical protein
MPYDKKPGAVTKMYDKKGKQTGLMMEGSVNHMESVMQEKKNLMQDMPIDNRGVGEMSPYKMDHGSAAHHSGKSKLHAKPGKDYPDDGHLHYQDGKKVESPGVSETKKLSDISGGVGQMSPYKFIGMSGGSAMHKTNPKEEGVTVTGDASKIGGVTSTARERRKEELARKREERLIELANKKMKEELDRETKKAELGKRRIQAQQRLREKQGKDYMTNEGVVVRRQ